MTTPEILRIVRIGMSREKVIALLGEPDSIGFGLPGCPKYLKYNLLELVFASRENGRLLLVIDEVHRILLK